MVVEDFSSYFQWLGLDRLFEFNFSEPSGIIVFLLVAVVLIALGLLFGYLTSAIRYGPQEAFYSVARVVGGTFPDIIHSSPRRIWGIARLAIQESIRRRVLLVAFVLFAGVVLVGGMFLDTDSAHPHRLYTSSMMFFTWLLIIIMVWLLSTSSLPNDIRNKTIYTVVTKPVRPLEIVLGRMLGFAAVGTLLLVLMGIVSYFFVLRHLSHSHEMVPDSVKTVAAANDTADKKSDSVRETATGLTTNDSYHRHKVTILSDGTGYTDVQHGHWHEVTITGEGEHATYEFGSPEGQLQARVPHYGKLSFLDEKGVPSDKGINVGNEWDYRGYFSGLGAGIWTFEDIDGEDFPNGLPLEMTLSVQRTYKGEDITAPVVGTITLQNSGGTIKSDPRPFSSAEYEVKSITIPQKLNGVKNGIPTTLDLFDDLCADGNLEIQIHCKDRNQYFGAAQADLYIRAADGFYSVNFFKGFLSIWFQMLIVVSLGVMFSTFLNAAVSMLATSVWIVFGYFASFIRELAAGQVEGGGPLESLIRLVTQQNVTTELELPKFISAIITYIDWALIKLMLAVSYMVPNFERFDVSEAVSKGYNVSFDLIARNATVTIGFVVLLAMMGYYLLKTREIAAAT